MTTAGTGAEGNCLGCGDPRDPAERAASAGRGARSDRPDPPGRSNRSDRDSADRPDRRDRSGHGDRRDRPAVRHLLDRIERDALATRRDYLRLLVTVSGGLLAGTVAVATGLFRRHGTGDGGRRRIAGALDRGDALAFSYPGDDDPALAVRLDDGSLVGWSSVCTHLACGVLYRRDEGDLYCPCHEGRFDVRTGEPVAGPPSRPLPQVHLVEERGGIWAVEADA
jgi:nitrite reductase/ring-hydroxylating ferredoxin subunit